MDFVLKMMNCTLKMMNYVLKMMIITFKRMIIAFKMMSFTGAVADGPAPCGLAARQQRPSKSEEDSCVQNAEFRIKNGCTLNIMKKVLFYQRTDSFALRMMDLCTENDEFGSFSCLKR